jgi:hypothetical protein
LPILTLVISIEPYQLPHCWSGGMAYSGQRHAGVGSSSRPANGFKGAANSVEFLGREMLGMRLRDAKPDTDDERVGFYHSLVGIWMVEISVNVLVTTFSQIHVQALSFPICAVL